MAATLISDIIVQARRQLMETTARFWSDAELTDIFWLGATDLWGAYLDIHQDHYFVVVESEDADGVRLEAESSQLTNVPADCFRVMLIEPLRTNLDPFGGLACSFVPRKYNHPDFVAARSWANTESALTAGVIYYDLTGPGAPIAAPVVRIAPQISTTVKLRFAYYPVLDTSVDYNPIPGGSDNALKAWVIAYANAKEGPQGSRIPDAGWLAVYSTEKQTLLTRSTPRQEQEADVADGLFDNYQY
jgi:hypothetical protein